MLIIEVLYFTHIKHLTFGFSARKNITIDFFFYQCEHVCFCRSASALLDISGFAAIPETPRRPHTTALASLHVLKRPPLEGDYISVTDSAGCRVYLRQKDDTGTKVNVLLFM